VTQKNTAKKIPRFTPENKQNTIYIVSQEGRRIQMKITKQRLKQIIKEELENLSTEMVDPRAPRHLQKEKGSPAIVDRTSAAGRHLVDAGILRDSDKGDPLERGMTTQDARQSLEAAGFDEAEIRDALRPLHIYYRE
jgi:hypothetical protein